MIKSFIIALLFVSIAQAQKLSAPGLLSNGEYCLSANECSSGFCSSDACEPPYYKVCDDPGRTCLPRETQCFFNSQCCSNLCSASGVCVADGKLECAPNGSKFRFSAQECCSGLGTSAGTCKATAKSCAYIGATCYQNSECCSKKCGASQRCMP